MHQYYDDILSRIDDEPLWFDETGVPRFAAFEPRRAASIYAEEVALGDIACQGCGRRFRVAFSHHNMKPVAPADTESGRDALLEAAARASLSKELQRFYNDDKYRQRFGRWRQPSESVDCTTAIRPT